MRNDEKRRENRREQAIKKGEKKTRTDEKSDEERRGKTSKCTNRRRVFSSDCKLMQCFQLHFCRQGNIESELTSVKDMKALTLFT